MQESQPRWQAVTPSAFAWEQEALEYLRTRLPDQEPYRVWTNLEFVAHTGSVYEVDLALLTPRGFFLVEIKSRPGTLTGDAGTWVWHDGRSSEPIDNPLLLTNRKAKALKSLLVATKAGRRLRHAIPFLEPLVFLSAPGLAVDLDDRARTGLFGRGGAPGEDHTPGRHQLPGIISFLTVPDPRSARNPSRRITSEVARLVAAAMHEAGIRPSRRSLRAGDYEIQRSELLTDGIGFQDFAAVHTQLPTVRKRVRVYPHESGSSNEVRESRERAAEREYLLLQTMRHPGVLAAEGFHRTERGPALVFEHDALAVRLDHWLTEHAGKLTADIRISIVRQLADVLRYAHSRRVAHRALSPRAVLVSGGPDDPTVKVFSWQTAGQLVSETAADVTGPSGTSHLDRFVDDATAAYVAPEALTNPNADGVALDVFSLGAVAYHVLSGRPPAPNAAELLGLLRDGGGLRLSAVLDGVGDGIHALIRDATCPDVGNRIDSVEWFCQELDEAQAEQLTEEQTADALHPADARPGDRLREYTVRQHMGKGSTAVALLVIDELGRERVLKVALDERRDDRIRAEAEVLRDLAAGRDHRGKGTIVQCHQLTTVGGRAALELDKAGDRTLARYLREHGGVGIDMLQRWGDDLLAAVAYLEARGRAHRDIKPANLGIAERGKKHKLHLVLFDFSLSSAPVDDYRAGTPPYLDPFLVDRPRRSWDTAAERYAAAVTLYEMATGITPRWGDGQSDPAALACEVTVDPDRLPSAVREEMAGFFTRALRRSPDNRFHTAEEMRRAWDQAFSRTHAEGSPVVGDGTNDRQTTLDEHLDAAAIAAEAGPDSPLAELGLSQRMLDVLERVQVLTVADLITTPPQAIRFGGGIVPRVRTQVLELREELRRRFPDLADTGRPRRTRRAKAPDGWHAAVADDVQPLDQLVDQLVPTPRRDDSRVREAVRLLLGLDPSFSGPGWPSQTSVARVLGLTPGGVSQVVGRQRKRWARNRSLRRLRDETARLLHGLGGVATTGELADAVASLRGTAELVDDVSALARAALRAACEVETAGQTPRWVQRRSGDLVVLAAEPIGAEGTDDAGGAARADWALRLGRLADRLAVEDPLLPRAAVLPRLRHMAPPPGAEPLADARLVRLAAAASSTAAVSARLELYPKGMDPARVLRLAQNALLISGAGGNPRVRLSEQDVEERLRSRYPDMAGLPRRPELDRLLADAGLPLEWLPACEGLQAGYVAPLPGIGLTGSGASSGSTATGTSVGGTRREEVVAATDERLDQALTAGGFLALTADPGRMEATAEALTLLGVTRVSVEARLLARLHEQADVAGVNWARVVDADARGPGTTDWNRLLLLMNRAWPLVDKDVRAAGDAVVLTELGPLARYGAMAWVDRWRDATLDPRSGLRSLWLLLPSRSASSPPAIDGVVVPLTSPNQCARLHRGWLEVAR